jgi:hypothetical protein
MEPRADDARVINLDAEDTGEDFAVGLVGDERCIALVVRHAGIFENKRTDDEVGRIQEGIEAGGESGGGVFLAMRRQRDC